MPDFNTFRINEELLGRIIASKRRDCHDPDYVPNRNARISDTIQVKNRTKDYHDWFRQIQQMANNKGMAKVSKRAQKDARQIKHK